jgi:cysteinyl-tRNA synthetase
MNITDVADRIVQKGEELKKDPLQLAREYENAFLEDIKALGITTVTRFDRASEYMPQIIAQVASLVDKGAAYETETGVYFEVRKFPNFGKLSGLTHEELGLRRLELCSSKRNPEDFSLWRKHESGLRWDSPWGFGRPGWHVEDTAISMKNFGETYDMHGGASELVFPHHEAEIAQAESLTGKAPFVRFWLHTGLLSIKGRKMSKSLGNVIRIRDALKQYAPADLRYYFASVHYRDSVSISELAIKRAHSQRSALQKDFTKFLAIPTLARSRKVAKLEGLLRGAEREFMRRMDDDFDTKGALRVLKRLAGQLGKLSKTLTRIDQGSKKDAERRFRRMATVFGVLS